MCTRCRRFAFNTAEIVRLGRFWRNFMQKFYCHVGISWAWCVIALALLTFREDARACACGCAIFDVATSSEFPTGPGGETYLQYAFQDQNQNWSGTSEAPASHNDDKEIKTDFLTLGLQYFFNYKWGIQAELPYDFRSFTTKDDAGQIVTRKWSQLGDVRLEGIYSGFFPDLSAGVDLGLKLPTGSHTFDSSVVDRDTQLGTGSTDILMGGFYRHSLTRDGNWNWFAQTELDLPVFVQDHYRPGLELDSAAGIYYSGWAIGRTKISPIGQVIISERTSDSGANAAHPVSSGFQRVLLSPGIEVHVHGPLKIYADVEIPVFQHFTGNQIVAPLLVKTTVSWAF